MGRALCEEYSEAVGSTGRAGVVQLLYGHSYSRYSKFFPPAAA